MVSGGEIPESRAKPVDLTLVQGASDLVFQQVHLSFPIALPRLAATINEIPSKGKRESQTRHDVGGIEGLFGCSLLKEKVSCKCGCNERPKIGRPLPVQF